MLSKKIYKAKAKHIRAQQAKSYASLMNIERPFTNSAVYQNVEHKMFVGSLTGTYVNGGLNNLIGNFGLGGLSEGTTTASRDGKIIFIHSIRLTVTMWAYIGTPSALTVDPAGTLNEVSVASQYARLLIYKVKNCSTISTTANTPSGNVANLNSLQYIGT